MPLFRRAIGASSRSRASSRSIGPTFHLKRALENGVTREEIIAAITHLAFYAGWPPAMTALQIAGKAFEETGK